MSYAVELVVTTHADQPTEQATPVQRLPQLHETIEEARSAGIAFLKQNGTYMASKRSEASTTSFQIVDDGGDLVVAPTGIADAL